MRNVILFGLAGAVLGLCGFDRQDAPGFDLWGTGDEALAYHRLSADCDEIEHAYGRSAAWGLWRMPLTLIIQEEPQAGERGGAILTFRCVDGAACIGAGRLEATPERVAEHAIPFADLDRARAFAARVVDLRTACGL